MSTLTGYLVTQCAAEATENIVGKYSYFDLPIAISTSVSDVYSSVVATQSADVVYMGKKALKVVISSSQTGINNLRVWSAQEGMTAAKTGLHLFNFRIRDTATVTQQSALILIVEVFKDGAAYRELVFNSEAENGIYSFKKWNTFACEIPLTAGSVYTWKYNFNCDILASPIFYIDGVSMVNMDRIIGLCPMYNKPLQLIPEIPITDNLYKLQVATGTPNYTV